MAYIRACLQLDVPQVPFCGIFPSVELLEEFSEHVKVANNGVPVSNLSSLMERFVEAARLDGKYGLSDHADMRLISNWLYTIPLSLQDRCCSDLYSSYMIVATILFLLVLSGLLTACLGLLSLTPQSMQETSSA